MGPMSESAALPVLAADVESAWSELSTVHAGVAVHRATSQEPSRQLFYALDETARPGLLAIGPAIAPPRLPTLEALDLQLRQRADGKLTLGIYLTEPVHRELLSQLISNVVNDLLTAPTPGHPITFVLDRLRRWQRLLERASRRALSIPEQQGLWGELLSMQGFLAKAPAREVVDAWRGPAGEAQDFRFKTHWIECKTIGAADNEVGISNLLQLEIGPVPLFLMVHSICEDPTGRSLPDLVELARATLSVDRAALDIFESLLALTGFGNGDDYPTRYILQRTRWYHVDGRFPRLASSTVPEGVLDARYRLRIPALTSFERPEPNHDT